MTTELMWDDRPADRRGRKRLMRLLPDGPVKDIMAAVPRHAFMPPEARSDAYVDAPLAIGAGQTISQPSLVARMVMALDVQPGDVVWDVGAGSGYVSYLLAQLVGPQGVVYADERQGSLARALAARLQEMPAPRGALFVRHADASDVPPEPVDRIHAGCVWDVVPEAWLNAVKPGGCMVLPVGQPDQGSIEIHRRTADGWSVTSGDQVAFVPGLPGLVDPTEA